MLSYIFMSVLVYFVSFFLCILTAPYAEKIAYGEDTSNRAIELITGAAAFVPVVNTFVAGILGYYYLKTKAKEF